MFPNNRTADGCPVPHEAGRCAFAGLPVCPFCRLCREGSTAHPAADYRRAVLVHSGLAREAVPPPPPPPPAPGRAAAAAATLDPGNVHHRRWLLVAGCDYRGPRVGCGCDGRHRCHRGVVGSYGPGEVTYGDCLACVGAARAGSG